MGKHRALEQDFYFDRHFFFRLGTIARLLFPTFDWAIVIIGLILLFQAANEYAGFNIGILPGKMYTDLMSRDAPSFWTHFWQGSLVLVGKCFLSSAVSFFASMLYLFWRKNIVKKMQERYFSHRIYYKMNCIDDHGIDNPDQRITQDVERMLNVLATSVIPSVLIGPFMVAFYSYKTASTAGGLGIAIIYAYFVLGTIVNRIVISPMTKWNARVEKAEGDFRYKHVTVRDNAESSALFNAQNFERLECERLFSVLWWRQIKFLSWRVLPLWWRSVFDYYGSILSYLIQYIPIIWHNQWTDLSGPTLAGKISQNAFVYIMLVNSFTNITDVALNVGDIAGILQRVAVFIETTEVHEKSYEGKTNMGFDGDGEETEELSPNGGDFEKRYHLDNPFIFNLSNVTFSIPSNPSDVIVYKLNIRMPTDKNLVITGPSGCGKSSLLRILSKLWPIRSGNIECGLESGRVILFLPQDPYFPSGRLSLWDQVRFPAYAPEEKMTNEDAIEIEELMNLLDLNTLVDRLGGRNGFTQRVDFEWQETLTPGEQQRLSLVRALFHDPSVVVLDEATSSVSVELEERMYNLLKKRDIQYISVGHRQTLLKHHDYELHLNGMTGWEIRDPPAITDSETVD